MAPMARQNARAQANARGGRPRELQRLRILDALAELACSRGTTAVSVADVVAAAGVSKRAFYSHFGSLRECHDAVVGVTIALASERAATGYRTGNRWDLRLRAGLTALLAYLDEERRLARFCAMLVESGDQHTLARRAQLREQLGQIVDEARTRPASGRSAATCCTGQDIVAAAFGAIHVRLLTAEQRPLLELTNPLMAIIVLPSAGGAAALTELSRRPGHRSANAGGQSPGADALQGLPMRITYRTQRVLTVIAAEPGLSNIEIGRLAGISDQGQASKLLARLARLDLIKNTGGGQSRGAIKAWQPTKRGKEIERAFRDKPIAGTRTPRTPVSGQSS